MVNWFNIVEGVSEIIFNYNKVMKLLYCMFDEDIFVVDFICCFCSESFESRFGICCCGIDGFICWYKMVDK